MADRILSVNAYTTFDLLDATVEGHGFEEELFAVLNVTSPRGEDHVELQVEADNTELDAVEPHADRVTLSPAQARELADELRSYADDAESDE